MSHVASELITRASFDVAVRETTSLVCFRGLPVAVWALFERRIRRGSRVALALVGVVFIETVRPWTRRETAELSLSYLYFLCLAFAVPFLATSVRDRRVTSSVVFVLVASAFFLSPLAFFPASNVKTATLVLGWNLTLAAYSYCLDISRSQSTPAPSDCLFFLLVNPALVYSQRGTRSGVPRLSLRALARSLLGFAMLLVAAALVYPLASVTAHGATSDRGVLSSDVPRWVAGILTFLGFYTQQSGLASFQIGSLRLLGYSIPERYDWPVLARDPLDFCRRWNTYVSGWLLRYVYWPLAQWGLRKSGTRYRRLAQGLSIFATFAVAGMLHDIYTFGLSLRLSTLSTRAFAGGGCIVVLSVGLKAVTGSLKGSPLLLLVLAKTTVFVLFWWRIIAFFAR